LGMLQGSTERMRVDAKYAKPQQREVREQILALTDPVVEMIPTIRQLVLG